MIQIDGISKIFNNHYVLQDVTLEIPAGQTHVLLGISGSGKSTLLKIMLGLISSNTGLVKINDLVVNPRQQRHVVQQVGYVIQDGGLFPHLTAYKNVALPGQLRGMNAKAIEERISDLGRLVGMDMNLLHQYPLRLSGGQRQRVALMRALMTDPSILVMDEPLGALDPIIRSALQEELKNIFKTLKKTVVLVTHDISEAAFFADQITLINQGRVVQTGTLSELIASPADPFVTEFIRAQRQPRELLDV